MGLRRLTGFAPKNKLDKAIAKHVARSAGIPTAPFAVRHPEGSAMLELTTLRYPLFAKPANEGSSMGITSASLCHDEGELAETVGRLGRYGPVLVEEFLPGEEYTVGIVDGEVLGAMQVAPRGSQERASSR